MNRVRVVYDTSSSKLVIFIFVNTRPNSLTMSRFCSKDHTTVRLTYQEEKSRRVALVTSAYFPWDSPTIECCQLVEYFELQKLSLLIGVDVNSYHAA